MLRRSLKTYASGSPRAVSDGSPAQVFYFVDDATHDIAVLAGELAGVVRILDAVRFQVGLGKTQLDRLNSAKAILDTAGDSVTEAKP